jgi:hypothetical protein
MKGEKKKSGEMSAIVAEIDFAWHKNAKAQFSLTLNSEMSCLC